MSSSTPNIKSQPITDQSTAEEPVYVLPKTYNGKTVTDLFPEFKHDSVLRFSKLFGVGRVTSLPKLWKGTRKRKKPRSEHDLSFTNDNLTQEEADNENKQTNENQNDIEIDDVFKIFDDEFNSNRKPSPADTIEKQKDVVVKPEVEIKAKIEKDKVPEAVEVVEADDIEFETDDEIAFLKPYIIDGLNKNRNKKSDFNNSSDTLNENQLNRPWEYGPASYWYQMYDIDALIDAKKKELDEKLKKEAKKLKKKKKSKSDDDDDEEEEEDEDDEEEEEEEDEKEKGTQSDNKDNSDKQKPSEFTTVNLNQAVTDLNLNNVIKDEHFLLVNTTNWEDNIIIDLNQTNTTNLSANQPQRNQTHELINERVKFAGWVPSSEHRTLTSFQSKILGKKVDFINQLQKDQSVPALSTQPSSKQSQPNHQPPASSTTATNWNSIFPNENYDLLLGDWEQKIIIDPENINIAELKPSDFCIDPNDDNLLLGVPEDTNHEQHDNKHKESTDNSELPSKRGDKLKLNENRSKLTKSIIGKSNALKEESHDNHAENDHAENSQRHAEPEQKSNFWNISNDDYYNPKAVADTQTVSKNISTALVLQHTQAAMELYPQFFPTHLSSMKLRNFHRMPLKRSLISNNESFIFNHVNSLLRKFKRQQDKPALQFPTSFSSSTNQLSSLPSTDFVSIRHASDLSGGDNSQLILAEYSEQYPPLMMQAGMAAKIRNYYKKKFSKDEGPKPFDFGELVYASSSPFLGALKPGEHLQAIENLMFRAPIYKHNIPEQDFLIIRSRSLGYLIRGDVRNVFVVGQECPLIEVPGPNSKRANSFLKDFLHAYLVRLFHESTDVPKRIKMEDVKKAFPTYPENSIRKRLKMCADFRRTGKSDTNWWILKEEVRLPTEEEIRGLITPEQCCAYYSMLAAEQRLKDAGYGEKNLFASDDDDVDNSKIDDEVKNAPWHTTRAYLDATKGKCLLQINGVADPTGRGEGFSYVRQAIKPNGKQEDEQNTSIVQEKQPSILASLNDSVASPQAPSAPKRTVTGTDADLRRLHLSQAKELLASYGVPDHEIKKLKRWEIIDVVRTMSTQKAKEGNGTAVSKFARGNRFSQSDAHEKFRDECQRLFELQNRNLASEEYLSTDDDEELDEDSDVDEMGKNLESMLQNKLENGNGSSQALNKATNKAVDNSSEIKNIIMNQASEKQAGIKDPKLDPAPPSNPNMQRILRITRTYRDEDTGQEYTKVEVVNKPLVIDAYVKIRSTRDDEFIRSAFALDETEKEKLRKERRRLQEQLRRVKRNEAKRATADNDNSPMDSTGAPKVRKYNKTGANRKPKNTSKSTKYINDSNFFQSENTNQSVVSSPEAKKVFNFKSSLQYSSGDEDRSQDMADFNDQTQMDTSSLNNTLTGANSSTAPVAKRKYQKRKKNEIDPSSLVALGDQAQAGSTGLTKVDGTKLIIQKKAIKLSINSEDGLTQGIDSASPIKKKYRTKKQLKLMEGNNNNNDLSAMVVDTSTNDAIDNDLTPKMAPKIKIVNKSISNLGPSVGIEQKSSIILTIPKEKLALASNEIVHSSEKSSPALDVSVGQSSTPQQQQRRQNNSNKQSSMVRKPQQRPVNQNYQQQQQQQQNQQQLQLQQQLQQQMSAQSSLETVAAFAAASQIANFFEQQQFLMAFQQQMLQSPNTPGLVFPQNPFTQTKQTAQTSQQQPQQQRQQQEHQNKRKSSAQNSQNCDYLVKPLKKVDRRHADPSVSLATQLELILNELRDMPESQQFLMPVNSKKVPDYYKLIKNPIDLQTIRKKINEKIYKNRSMFLDDVRLLVDNSQLYNGPNHIITKSAEKLYNVCARRIEEKQDQLTRLEKAINPLLDDNSLIVFNYLLDQIYEQYIISMENSFSFLKPVNKAKYKDYYDIIKQPIDLETIKQRITSKKYKSRDEFISDFELLYRNCLTYNGLNNSYTDTAQKMLDTCKQAVELDEYRDQMQSLEDEIAYALRKQSNDDDSSRHSNNHQSHSGYARTSSMMSTEAYNDTESNLAINTNTRSSYHDNESMDGQMSSNQALLPNPKKMRPVGNKKSTSSVPSVNNINSNINIIKPISSNSNLLNKKGRRNILALGEIVKNRNSPKSGSDAEVFVDVESIDDRMTGIGMVGNRARNDSFRNNFKNRNEEQGFNNEYNFNDKNNEYANDGQYD